MMSVFWLLILLIGHNYDDDVGGRVPLLARGGGEPRGLEALTLAGNTEAEESWDLWILHPLAVERGTKVHEDFTIMEKASTTTKLKLVTDFLLASEFHIYLLFVNASSVSVLIDS